VKEKDARSIGRLISAAENFPEEFERVKNQLITEFQQEEANQNQALSPGHQAPILGITGTGGAGKSSLVDELVRRFLMDFPDKTIAIISVDPSKRKTGGALLGDRIRMNAINSPRVYMRSLATRQSNLALSRYVQDAVDVVRAANYDLIILETSGIGQSDTEIIEHSDASLYVMTPEYGAATQLEKIDMLDFADVIALNKFDKRGALDALRDVRKQYQRNHGLWDTPRTKCPVFGTIASQFNDPGMNRLYRAVLKMLETKTGASFASSLETTVEDSEKIYIIPAPPHPLPLRDCRNQPRLRPARARAGPDCGNSRRLRQAGRALPRREKGRRQHGGGVQQEQANPAPPPRRRQPGHSGKLGEHPAELPQPGVRVLGARQGNSGADAHQVALGQHDSEGGRAALHRLGRPPALGHAGELPGEFPYTAGVFPFKREGEDPTRMFAGEGGPERTNRRFHYVSMGLPAKRLSTAFDSVTLYGEDPDLRPDIYGKIGNAGVSIACLDDAKKLYSGFNLANPSTSVSMTINGPAAHLAAFFMNAAIDQQCELYIKENGLEAEVDAKIDQIYAEKNLTRPRYQGELPDGNDGLGLLLLGVTGDQVLPADVYATIKARTLTQVRGTVQADILKEDQAQNTCIFSTEFALRLMGDVQEYFIQQKVRNFYSVSISGYHIAEAGANPITQLALTLSNGFTFVEYYVSRGMSVNDFAPNLSFFFSNGIDPEYAVIGRVARRIWAKAMKLKYGADARSQMLKYHIQTSGRSLHAQEIDFNDIRTTLQALYAIYDNCNSLHTNAYDEAITTPTEESVRRAMAIQLIINRELGWPKTRTRCKAPSSSRSSPTWWKRRCCSSSTASRSAAACSGPWKPCTSAAKSRRKACTTRC
jgi:methylmalonyl-CoA mutase